MSRIGVRHRRHLRARSSRAAAPDLGTLENDEDGVLVLDLRHHDGRPIQCVQLAARRLCCREHDPERTQCYQLNGTFQTDLIVGSIAILMCLTITALMIRRLH